MQVKVLGSVAPYPKGSMNCSSFLVSENGTNIMLDTGFSCSRELDILRDLKNLSIIISHYHPDHYGDLTAIANMSYIAHKLGYLDSKIDVYLPEPIREKNHNYGEWKTPKFMPSNPIDYDYLVNSKNVNYFNFHKYKSSTKLHIGTLSIYFSKNIHPIDAYAIKIESSDASLVYSSDTDYRDSLSDFSQNTDLLICEASFLKGQCKGSSGHLYAYEAGRIAKNSNAKSLYLFHTFPEIEKEKYVEEAREEFAMTSSLSEGQIIKLERKKKND